MSRIVDSGLRWAAIQPRGPQHAFREHWRGGDIWAPECASRNFYPQRTLTDFGARPLDGKLCKQPGCQHALTLLPDEID